MKNGPEMKVYFLLKLGDFPVPASHVRLSEGICYQQNSSGAVFVGYIATMKVIPFDPLRLL